MKLSKTQLEIIAEIYRKTVFEPLETFSPDYVEEANHKSKIFYKKLESKLGKEIANEFEETKGNMKLSRVELISTFFTSGEHGQVKLSKFF